MSAPSADLLWIRGSGSLDWRRPNVFFVLGRRGAGKSSFLEFCACRYLEEGAKVIDLFGSRDGEGLAWLRSPYARDRRIVLLHGDLVEVSGRPEALPASRFSLADLERGDIFISASPLYESMDAEFDAVNRLVDQLWRRTAWREPLFLIVREAANLLYSRVKVRKNQTVAKAEMLYMLRESRHVGIALGLDSIKHTSIDADTRILTDYLVLKNVGLYGLPQDLWWVYSLFDPTALRRLRPQEFVLIDRLGNIALGVFDFPAWHKKEREDILQEVGLRVKYYLPGRDSDQALSLVGRALEELPPDPEPNQVSAWIKEKYGVDLGPISVGKLARRLGYFSERVSVGGRIRNVLRRGPAAAGGSRAPEVNAP